jgi:hypothetical protein
MGFAKNVKTNMPCVKFNKQEYNLYYSSINSESNTRINEYYKPNESYTSWTELIAVHHYKNEYSPIDLAQLFRNYLSDNFCPSAMTIDEDDNSAILDFIVIENKKLPIVLEFNIFKYQKSADCGTIALQYAKRYRVNSALEVEKVKKLVEQNRAKDLKKIKKLQIPEIVSRDVENGKYINTEAIQKDNQPELN